MNKDPIAAWLKSTGLISRFCTQNGWIDDDSVHYEIRDNAGGDMRVNVYFTEVVMEGSGCVAGRIDCFGQLALRLDEQGEVAEAKPL